MRAGLLDQRIRIERKQRVADGIGGWSETWSVVDTVWARAMPLRGDEQVAAQQVEARTVIKFQVRYMSGISTSDRLVWESNDDRLFNIRAIEDGGSRRSDMWVTAEEGVAT